MQESEKSEKITSNDLTSFFLRFLLMFSNKNSHAPIKKTRQNVDGIFSEISYFDRKPKKF